MSFTKDQSIVEILADKETKQQFCCKYENCKIF